MACARADGVASEPIALVGRDAHRALAEQFFDRPERLERAGMTDVLQDVEQRRHRHRRHGHGVSRGQGAVNTSLL